MPLAAKLPLFEANLTLVATPLREPDYPPLGTWRRSAGAPQLRTGRRCMLPALARRAAYSEVGHDRDAGSRGVGGACHGTVANEFGRSGVPGGPEAALPTCVRDYVQRRPVAITRDAAHAAVTARGASRCIYEAERGAWSVTHLAAMSPRFSTRAFGALSDDTPNAGFSTFTCCGVGRLAGNARMRAGALVHRCGYTGSSRR